ncbi:unknown protein [Seminavis robusta]|uniref:Uncharacterized protein n=1 Tax=Seminavis robusta TaxID=568900 RepID=A0A9N8HUT2_9STRA|nr:unknown protein [Seminavis robusta]|eukprot:Sro2157_g316920.1 n/a (484) ;mRNA; r:10955-12581
MKLVALLTSVYTRFGLPVGHLHGATSSEDAWNQILAEASRLCKQEYNPNYQGEESPRQLHQGYLRICGRTKDSQHRTTIKSEHKEVIYRRLNPAKISNSVAWIRKTNTEEDGYNGLLGVCDYHPRVFQKHKDIVWKKEGFSFKNFTPCNAPATPIQPVERFSEVPSPPRTPETPSAAAMMEFLNNMDEESRNGLLAKFTTPPKISDLNGDPTGDSFSTPAKTRARDSPHLPDSSPTKTPTQDSPHVNGEDDPLGKMANSLKNRGLEPLDGSDSSDEEQLFKTFPPKPKKKKGVLKTKTKDKTLLPKKAKTNRPKQVTPSKSSNHSTAGAKLSKNDEPPQTPPPPPTFPEPIACDPSLHLDIANFTKFEKSYFTPAIRSKHPEWAEKCIQCEQSIWEQPVKDVWMCENTKKANCCCKYALCKPCWMQRLQKGVMGHLALASPEKRRLNEEGRILEEEDGFAPRKSARKRIKLSDKENKTYQFNT